MTLLLSNPAMRMRQSLQCVQALARCRVQLVQADLLQMKATNG